MTYNHNTLYIGFLNNAFKSFEDLTNIVSANQSQVQVQTRAFMLVWHIRGYIRIHLIPDAQNQNLDLMNLFK